MKTLSTKTQETISRSLQNAVPGIVEQLNAQLKDLVKTMEGEAQKEFKAEVQSNLNSLGFLQTKADLKALSEAEMIETLSSKKIYIKVIGLEMPSGSNFESVRPEKGEFSLVGRIWKNRQDKKRISRRPISQLYYP